VTSNPLPSATPLEHTSQTVTADVAHADLFEIDVRISSVPRVSGVQAPGHAESLFGTCRSSGRCC
jgi:hypothetical protein